MKVVHFYRTKDKAWVSPGEWWDVAVKSARFDVLMHGNMHFSEILYAITDAVDYLGKVLRLRITHSAGVMLTGLGLAFLFEWPVIHFIPEIQRGIQVVFLIAAAIGFLNIILGIYSLLILKRSNPSMGEIREGLVFPPPPMAYRKIELSKPKLVVPILIVALSLVLNSVVFATYKTPAVVWAEDAYVVTNMSLITPWTKWEQSPRIIEGMLMTYFSMDGDKHVWVVKAEYQIDHKDLYRDVTESEVWLQNVLNYFVDNISSSVHAQMPEDTEDPLQVLVAAFQDRELISKIETLLKSWYGARHADAQLQWVRVTIEKITVSEYTSYIRSRS